MNPIPPLKTWLVAAVLVAIASGSVQAKGNKDTGRRSDGRAPICTSGTDPSQHASDVPRDDLPSLVYAAAGYALGEVWGRPVQDPRTRQLVAISAFLAQGNIEHLKTAARHALEIGVTEEQLREVAYLTLARAGTASGTDAVGAIGEVMAGYRALAS